MTETKREKFIRVAEARTNKIIDMVRLLGNCSNRGAYDYTEEEVKKIFAAIKDEVHAAERRFQEQVGKKGKKFKL